jgi:hypothetical protein
VPGTALPKARQIEQSLGFYSEYGIIDPLTLSLAWDVKWIDKNLGEGAPTPPATNAGIPEVRIGLRGRIIRAPFVMAAELIVGIPAQAPRLEPVGFDPQAQVPLGLGTTHATAWMHFAKSWSDYFPSNVSSKFQTYTNVALGFQYRDNFLSNFVFSLEWGGTIYNHAFLTARYFGEKNVGERQGGVLGQLIGQSDQQRYAVGAGFVWEKYIFALVEYSAPTGGTNSLLFQRVGVSLATSY